MYACVCACIRVCRICICIDKLSRWHKKCSYQLQCLFCGYMNITHRHTHTRVRTHSWLEDPYVHSVTTSAVIPHPMSQSVPPCHPCLLVPLRLGSHYPTAFPHSDHQPTWSLLKATTRCPQDRHSNQHCRNLVRKSIGLLGLIILLTKC